MRMLQTYAPVIFSVIVFILMRFRPFRPSTLMRYVCVFDENAQCITVDGRPKRIEMYAISNENK